uniref:Ephrin RBD domain-containing protein n=1 Tax=Trichobilharzia regenti TaxID=157069 RepID=A0AA85JTI9_TRIRE|nr:unnamed protein product [Trichobilharzia regenti]
MNNSSTWYILFVLLSFIHCILLPLTSAWKIAPSEIPADSILSNGETNGELDGTPGWIDEMNTVPSYLIAPSNKMSQVLSCSNEKQGRQYYYYITPIQFTGD